MRNGFLKAAGTLLLGAGLSWAQGPVTDFRPATAYPYQATPYPVIHSPFSPVRWGEGAPLTPNPSPPLSRGQGETSTSPRPWIILPSPLERGRGVGGEGVERVTTEAPLTPNPSPPLSRGRGEKEDQRASEKGEQGNPSPQRAGEREKEPLPAPKPKSEPVLEIADPGLCLPELGCHEGDEPCPSACKVMKEKKGSCLWVHADYLLWWVKDGPIATPLVTTGPSASLGIPGRPGTTVLAGEKDFDYGALQGIRGGAGIWLTDGIALGVSGFYLEQGNEGFTGVSNQAGAPLLARPIFDARSGRDLAIAVASPGVVNGQVVVDSRLSLWGLDTNVFLLTEASRPDFRLNLLAGFRYLDLRDQLNILQNSNLISGFTFLSGSRVNAPASLALSDNFETHNRFYGGQVGVQTGIFRGRWTIGFTGKIALGVTNEILDISGSSTVASAAGSRTVPGGVLALPTNMTRISRSELAFAPEGTLELGVRLTDWLSASVGGNFLYWSRVARVGDTLTNTVNATQIPVLQATAPMFPPAVPVAGLRNDDFWAYGLTAGLAIHY